MLVDFEEAVKRERVLNKQTLGSKMQADEAKYMVGIFKNGMLLRVYTLKFFIGHQANF
jgi:DNA-directed RNA polymerase-3 subunit RPC5